MLTTQKRVVDTLLPVLIAALLTWVTGCTPAGSRAMQEGERLRLQGKAAEAAEVFTRGATLLRTNAQAWNRVGLASHAAGQVTNALKAYHQALVCARDRDPETIADVRYNLGCLQLEQGNFGGAESEFSAYTLLRPKSVEGWTRLAASQLRAKRLEAAERSYAQALALDRKDPDALNGVGVLMVHKRRPRDAYAYFSSVLMSQANHPAALLNVAVLSHRQLNLKPLALQKYREYLALEPRPANWEAVNAIASQLQAELKPPPPPAVVVTNVFLTNAVRAATIPVTNPPPATPVPTNAPRPTPPAVVTEPPKLPAAPPKPVVTSTSAPTAAPAVPATAPTAAPAPVVQHTNLPVIPPAPAKPTNVVVATPPSEPVHQDPPAKIEEVRLPEPTEPKVGAAVPRDDPKPSEEAVPAQPTSAPVEPVAAPSEPPSPIAVPPPTPSPKKPGLLSRMNPVRWFGGGKEEEPRRGAATIPLPGAGTTTGATASPLVSKPVVPAIHPPPAVRETPAAPAAAPKPVVPRYKRLNPAAPTAGDRAAAETPFNMALEAHRKAQWRDAIEGYSRAVSADPSFYEAQHNLALASLNGGDITRALVAGETAIAIRAEPEARYNLALILQRAGFPLDAADELESLIKSNDDHLGAHFLLGNLWAQDLNDPAQARPHYRKVLELDPNHPQAVSIRYWLAAHP